jgi:hypothetical protein
VIPEREKKEEIVLTTEKQKPILDKNLPHERVIET